MIVSCEMGRVLEDLWEVGLALCCSEGERHLSSCDIRLDFE